MSLDTEALGGGQTRRKKMSLRVANVYWMGLHVCYGSVSNFWFWQWFRPGHPSSNLLSLNSSKTEFLVLRLKRQLAKIHNPSTSIDTTQSARNLGFIFDEHLSFSDQFSALSKSCYRHIRALRCIRPYLDLHTTKIIVTSIVHFKLDYCNSLYYGLPKYEINHLQHWSSPTLLLLELLSRLQTSNTSLLFWNLFTRL